MRVAISPSVAYGNVIAPPSKSVAHRALICGALSKGGTIHNIVYSQDVEATLRCLEAMGASIKRDDDSVTLGGLNPFAIHPNTVLDCGESGSTLRFLLPLCLLSSVPVVLTGSQRLLERPLDVYEAICREQNLSFVRSEHSVTVCGPLSAGNFRVRGDVSSQFISGLMLALALLDEDSSIDVTEPFESVPYVVLTKAVQDCFGVPVLVDNTSVSVRGKGIYIATAYTVEGDCSNGACLDAFNLLGGDVKVFGLSPETAQGDWVYKRFYSDLRQGKREFDLSDCPDLGPVMFALVAALDGAKFVGTQRLRLKESDRVAAMAQELAKFGVSVTVGENTVEIHHSQLQTPTQILCGHNDHRIVMALSLLCSKVGGKIDGAEAVAKSYPDFFDVLRALSVDVRIEE